MRVGKISEFTITRFEFKRDRVIGDSQVGFDRFHGFALEIKDKAGHLGLGLPSQTRKYSVWSLGISWQRLVRGSGCFGYSSSHAKMARAVWTYANRAGYAG